MNKAAPPRPRRAARRMHWLAWGLVASALIQISWGLILASLNHLTLRRFISEYLLVNMASALMYAVIGALIVTHRPRNTIGLLACVAGALFALNAWVGQYARYVYVTNPGAWPGGALAAWLYISTAVPVIGTTLLFPALLFPDGRLPSARWRSVGSVATAAVALMTFNFAFSPGPIDASLAEISNPFAVVEIQPILKLLQPVSLTFMLASLAGSVAAPIARWQRAQGVERQQLKWFAYAMALVIAATVIPGIVDPSGIVTPETGDTFLSGLALGIAYPLLPIAIGIAILRYRLYNIDLLISRTVVYSTLTACIVAIYVIVVGSLGALLQAQGNLLISLVATGLVAMLFQPLRVRLQSAVNRWLYGERDDPYAVLTRLGTQLEQSLAPTAVLQTIVTTVRDSLKLSFVTMVLEQDDEPIVAATAGTLGEVALRLPLVYQGESVGAFILGPRTPGEALTAADHRLLADLARHAGGAAHAVRLTFEVQHARERLVRAREEERRRLRRDLHDGLSPSLAAHSLKIGAVRYLVGETLPSADAILSEVQNDLEQTMADVKRLVYDLRPPALDELGLLGAVRAVVAPYALSGAPGTLAITVDAPDTLPPLGAAVEVAALRIVQEGLANVAKHACAQHCSVRLAAETTLDIEILDDGVGLGRDHHPGVGLRSMRERAEELGGTCSITQRDGGGTQIVAHLPFLPALPDTAPIQNERRRP